MTFLSKVTFLASEFDLLTNLNFIFCVWLKARNIEGGNFRISGIKSERLTVILVDAILNSFTFEVSRRWGKSIHDFE